jgi:hypothetical protein
MSKRPALGPISSGAVRLSRRATCTCVALAATLALLVAASSGGQSPDQRLERQRLRLDIERLQRESGWQADVQRWLPAASVLVALAVAGYGVWRYFDERRRERTIRTDEGVSHNLERLADRPPGGTNLNARAIVALRNLNALAPVASDARVGQHRVEVTEAVTALVRDDLKAFDTTDDARFPVICIDHWAELKKLTEEDPEFCFLMLERYLAALKSVAGRAPAYVRNVKREGGRYTREAALVSLDDSQFFAAIVAGFERLILVAPRGDRREEAIRDFSATAKALGPQLFPSGP